MKKKKKNGIMKERLKPMKQTRNILHHYSGRRRIGLSRNTK